MSMKGKEAPMSQPEQGRYRTLTAEAAESRLESFDIYDPTLPPVVYDVLEHGRRTCPVAYSPANGGFHLVTRYEDVTAVLRDDATFSSAHGKSLPHRQTVLMPPLDSDPPLHGEFRRLLNPFLSRPGLKPHVTAIRDTAAETVASLLGRPECDVYEDFASPLTATIMARVILGIEDSGEVRRVQGIVDAIGRGNAAAAWGRLQAYVADLLGARRAAGPGRGDILDAVVSGEVDGRPLTAEEQRGTTTVLLLGGLDTTTGAIGSIIYRMTLDPDLEARVRDPGWMRRDFDELLRLDSPVTTEARYVTRDTELAGVPLRAGEYVLLHFGSANRDEVRFEHASTARFDRAENRHIGFGLGIHRCIGSNLARMTIALAFEELLRRVCNIRSADGREIHFTPGLSWRPAALRIRYDRVGGPVA
jgi:cytochrome P450